MVIEAMKQVTREFELVSADGTRYAMRSEIPMLMTRVKMSGILDYSAEKCQVPSRDFAYIDG
jgi:hypothetical protein